MTMHDTPAVAPTDDPWSNAYDVVVIGGGQAGLAIGYHLRSPATNTPGWLDSSR